MELASIVERFNVVQNKPSLTRAARNTSFAS
jgi:hypothetical protein